MCYRLRWTIDIKRNSNYWIDLLESSLIALSKYNISRPSVTLLVSEAGSTNSTVLTVWTVGSVIVGTFRLPAVNTTKRWPERSRFPDERWTETSSSRPVQPEADRRDRHQWSSFGDRSWWQKIYLSSSQVGGNESTSVRVQPRQLQRQNFERIRSTRTTSLQVRLSVCWLGRFSRVRIIFYSSG